MPMPITWDPEAEAFAHIKGRLDAALGGPKAYLGLIPQEQSLPAVRCSFFMRRNQMTNGQDITMSTLRGNVLAVAPTLAVVQDLSQQIAGILHKASGNVAGSQAYLIACTYLEPLSMTEGDRASIVRHMGGVYELILQVAP